MDCDPTTFILHYAYYRFLQKGPNKVSKTISQSLVYANDTSYSVAMLWMKIPVNFHVVWSALIDTGSDIAF